MFYYICYYDDYYDYYCLWLLLLNLVASPLLVLLSITIRSTTTFASRRSMTFVTSMLILVVMMIAVALTIAIAGSIISTLAALTTVILRFIIARAVGFTTLDLHDPRCTVTPRFLGIEVTGSCRILSVNCNVLTCRKQNRKLRISTLGCLHSPQERRQVWLELRWQEVYGIEREREGDERCFFR